MELTAKVKESKNQIRSCFQSVLLTSFSNQGFSSEESTALAAIDIYLLQGINLICASSMHERTKTWTCILPRLKRDRVDFIIFLLLKIQITSVMQDRCDKCNRGLIEERHDFPRMGDIEK